MKTFNVIVQTSCVTEAFTLMCWICSFVHFGTRCQTIWNKRSE